MKKKKLVKLLDTSSKNEVVAQVVKENDNKSGNNRKKSNKNKKSFKLKKRMINN